jgi:hypothetical protein
MTAVFCPQKYTGEFATIHYQENRGWQVTLWKYGQAKRYSVYDLLSPAILEILQAGFIWANFKMQQIFENDVLLAGE